MSPRPGVAHSTNRSMSTKDRVHGRDSTIRVMLRVKFDGVQRVFLLHAIMHRRKVYNDVFRAQRFHDLRIVGPRKVLQLPSCADDALRSNMLLAKFTGLPIE